MRMMSKPDRRQAFYGWVRWTPVLGLVFSVLFFDAWVNIETRKSDYRLGELSGKARELEAQLDAVRVRTASAQTIDALAEAAPALGLAEALPEQFETIIYDPAREGSAPLMRPFVMAQLDGKRTVRDLAVGAGFNPLAGLLPALIATEESAPNAAPMPEGPLLLEAVTPPLDLEEIAPPRVPALLEPMTPDSGELDTARAHMARS
jgi:hypothetical protein